MKTVLVSFVFFTVVLIGDGRGAQAIGLGSLPGNAGKVQAVAGDAAKMAVKEDVNKWLSQQNCQCDGQTGLVSGCNISAIAKYVGDRDQALKTALNRSIRFHARSNRLSCSWAIRDVVQPLYGSWSYDWTESKSVNKVQMWVD